jgi:hypothetical protein
MIDASEDQPSAKVTRWASPLIGPYKITHSHGAPLALVQLGLQKHSNQQDSGAQNSAANEKLANEKLRGARLTRLDRSSATSFRSGISRLAEGDRLAAKPIRRSVACVLINPDCGQ